MIIYYAMTKFHLIFSIVHKRRTYGDQEAVLFVYSGLQGIEEGGSGSGRRDFSGRFIRCRKSS